MKEVLLIATLLIMVLLAVSVVAQLAAPSEEAKKFIIITPEKLREELKVTPEEFKERMMEGRIKLNFTPYLQNLPVFPPMRCPAHMLMKLPYPWHVGKVHGDVMRYLHEKNLTLREICTDRSKVESLVREAIEKIDLPDSCKGLEKAAEHCKKIELTPFSCDRIRAAMVNCTAGLATCKAEEKRFEASKEIRGV